MTRQKALEEVTTRIKNKNLVKHMLAAEAIMRELAVYLDQDTDKWGLAGLLHDIDYMETADDPARHSILAAEILREMGVDEDIIYAIKTHNDYHGFERKTLMDKALYATDPTTGLIVAGALILPEKKLDNVDVSFIMNRFHEKSFAKGARREQIKACSELGLELEQFISIAIQGMKKIKGELGL